MNFEVEYTPEQESFRKEVREFLEAAVPAALRETKAEDGQPYEKYLMCRELGRKLGTRGWLFPTEPKEYGGGGLSADHAMVLSEELGRFDLGNPPFYDAGASLGGPTIRVWGTEEQKKQYLPPMYRGEVRAWQLLTEPSAGSDLASVQTRAIRDGDEYVLNGQKIFIGSDWGADWFWTIAVTNPEAPRHQNVSWFMIDSSLPGITVQEMELLTRSDAGGVKNSIFFDGVRVPASALVGGENNGWKVASTHLELEHGGGGGVGRFRMWDRIAHYCAAERWDDKRVSDDQDARDQLSAIFADVETGRLFGLRNFYLAHANKPRSYGGPQANAWRKLGNRRRAEWMQNILGYYSLVSDEEYAPEEGHVELFQRSAIMGTHPGGTVEVLKLIMARRIGIGRSSREEAGDLG